MTFSSDDLFLVESALKRADYLADVLRRAPPRTRDLLPLDAERLRALDDRERDTLDAYLKRYENACEAARPVLRSGLLLIERTRVSRSYIDMLNEAERQAVLPSAMAWLDVMETRNAATHEYAMEDVEAAVLSNVAVARGEVLLEQLQAATYRVRDVLKTVQVETPS